jgi:hypothetical protein
MIQLQYVDDIIQLQCVDDMIQLQCVDGMIQLQCVDGMIQLQCVDGMIQLQFATNLSFWQPLSSLALHPFILALATLTTDANSVLSKASVLHHFTPVFLQNNSTASIHPNLGLPFSLLLVLPSINFFTAPLPPLLQHSHLIPICVL